MLNKLKSPRGARKKKKRLGYGVGSTRGRNCTRGLKGQTKRNKVHPWLEGGQLPIFRRLPKKGFKNPMKKDIEIVNLHQLEQLNKETITIDDLKEKRLITKKCKCLKILGSGELTKKIQVEAHLISEKALEKIKAAGGKFKEIKNISK